MTLGQIVIDHNRMYFSPQITSRIRFVGWIINPKPTQSDPKRYTMMVDCWVIFFSSSITSWLLILRNLWPRSVPGGTPAHTQNCRVGAYQRLLTLTTGNNLRLIVSASGLYICVGFGHRQHTHQWQKGWKITSFWPYCRGVKLGLWVSTTTQTLIPPANITLPSLLIVT